MFGETDMPQEPKCIDPLDRFTNTTFSNEVFGGASMSSVATYSCPSCGTRIGFHRRDFEAAGERRSNLAEPLQRCLDAYAAGHPALGSDFVDWLCPSCGKAARVYVELWAGGKHGDRGANLLAVLECDTDAAEPTDAADSR